MSRTLPFDAAQGHLRELVEGMVPGEELVLTAGGEPIAIVTRPPNPPSRRLGTGDSVATRLPLGPGWPLTGNGSATARGADRSIRATTPR